MVFQQIKGRLGWRQGRLAPAHLVVSAQRVDGKPLGVHPFGVGTCSALGVHSPINTAVYRIDKVLNQVLVSSGSRGTIARLIAEAGGFTEKPENARIEHNAFRRIGYGAVVNVRSAEDASEL